MTDSAKFDPRTIDPAGGVEANERYLQTLDAALFAGGNAVRSVAGGCSVDPGVLEEYAEALEGLRLGMSSGLLSSNVTAPTEEDVRLARKLAGLAREGASIDALIELARRVAPVGSAG